MQNQKPKIETCEKTQSYVHRTLYRFFSFLKSSINNMGGNVNFAKTSFISLKIKVDEDGKFLIFAHFVYLQKNLST